MLGSVAVLLLVLAAIFLAAHALNKLPPWPCMLCMLLLLLLMLEPNFRLLR